MKRSNTKLLGGTTPVNQRYGSANSNSRSMAAALSSLQQYQIPQPTRDPRLASREGRAAISKMTNAQPPLTNESLQPLKRRRSSETNDNTARKRHHHQLTNTQTMPACTEPAPQDPTFIQSQLLRSISSALTIVGYDTVRPSALEAFRAEVEEYMLHFLSSVKTSMAAARRTQAIPYDFIYALDTAGLASSDLEAHLELPFPPALAAPTITSPAPAERPPLNLAPMLGLELHTPPVSENEVKEASYIPAHFPPLPSRHSYLSTSVFTEREKDARKIRERATEEGILAEQALRRLTAARVNKVDRQGGVGVKGGKKEKKRLREESWKGVMADLMGDEEFAAGADSGDAGFGFDGGSEGGQNRKDGGDAVMRSGGVGVGRAGSESSWRVGAGAAVG